MVWQESDYQLIKEARACRICADHLPLDPKPIFQLHPQAKIALLSQAPGRIAHESGEAWHDPSGKRLRAWLGVTEEEFFAPENFAVLPLGLCYPGRGKGGDLPPRPECAPCWQKALLALLPELKLKLLIGGHAMRYHLGGSYPGSVGKTLAIWPEFAGQGIFPLPHPSPRNRAWLSRLADFEEALLPALRRRIAETLTA